MRSLGPHRRRAVILAVASVVSAASIAVGLLALDLRSAKTGKDLRSTYRMYHFGLLGTVRFVGCEVRVAPPWLPQRDSYEDLTISDNEVIFVDYTKSTSPGAGADFSLIRRDDVFRTESLGPVQEINGMRVHFVDPELTSKKALHVAWIVDSRVYALSESKETLVAALSSIELRCGK